MAQAIHALCVSFPAELAFDWPVDDYGAFLKNDVLK